MHANSFFVIAFAFAAFPGVATASTPEDRGQSALRVAPLSLSEQMQAGPGVYCKAANLHRQVLFAESVNKSLIKVSGELIDLRGMDDSDNDVFTSAQASGSASGYSVRFSRRAGTVIDSWQSVKEPMMMKIQRGRQLVVVPVVRECHDLDDFDKF